MSSLRTRAVKEMETMCKNSFSKRSRDMIMIAAPKSHLARVPTPTIHQTYLDTNWSSTIEKMSYMTVLCLLWAPCKVRGTRGPDPRWRLCLTPTRRQEPWCKPLHILPWSTLDIGQLAQNKRSKRRRLVWWILSSHDELQIVQVSQIVDRSFDHAIKAT